MQIRFSPNQIDYQRLGTDELRTVFLVESLFSQARLISFIQMPTVLSSVPSYPVLPR